MNMRIGTCIGIGDVGAGLPKNLSVYWVFFSSLALWFLFLHAPPILRGRYGHAFILFDDPAFAIHLFGAYTIYLVCVHNTILTPSSLNGDAKKYHIYVGRFGMIAGLIGFIFGTYCAWSPYRPYPVDQGFAIGITIGGAMQVMTQVMGYMSIRKYQRLRKEVDDLMMMSTADGDGIYYGSMDDGGNGNVGGTGQHTQLELLEQLTKKKDEALKGHVGMMIGLFAVACGIPAALRILDSIAILESNATLSIVATIMVLNALTFPFRNFYFKRMG